MEQNTVTIAYKGTFGCKVCNSIYVFTTNHKKSPDSHSLSFCVYMYVFVSCTGLE